MTINQWQVTNWIDNNTSTLRGAFDTPRFFPLQDRYGNWRVVLVVGRGARLRVVDWHPRQATAYAA